MPRLDGLQATRRLAGPGVEHPIDVIVVTTFSSVLLKLGLHSRVQAVILAYETGLVSPGTPTEPA